MPNSHINIYSPEGHLIKRVPITKDAERVEGLMGADYVQLSWSGITITFLPAGTYVEYENERFTLLDPYTPEQKDELEFVYKPQFQSVIMSWGKVPFFHYTYGVNNAITAREPDWTLTDTPRNFMLTVAKAIQNETGEVWSISVAADLEASATISFSSTDILSALSSIASEFNTEWRADKTTRTIYLGKAYHGTEVNLSVGDNVGVPSVTQSKEGYYNRFYVYGSTRNITQDYQGANANNLVNKRLTLNPTVYPEGYIDVNDGANEIFSKILIFDEVYPHSELTISNLRARLMYRLDESTKDKIQVGTDAQGNPVYDMYTIWYFQIKGFTLNATTYSKDNPDGMLISGKNLSAHFKTGALQGREFELIYHEKSKKLSNSDGEDFQVLAGDYEIKFIEDGGFIVPMQFGIVPSDGDEVILFNIRMPQEYIASAYTELATVALKEIEGKYTSDLNNYTVKSNPIAFNDNDPHLSVGRAVCLLKSDGSSLSSRVIKIVRKMDYTCEQEITIGNDKIKGNTATLKEEVANANANINILTQLNQLNQNVTQAYQRTQQLILDNLLKSDFSSMFEWVPDETLAEGGYIKAKANLLGIGEIVASNRWGGSSSGVGGSVTSYLNDLLDVRITLPSEGQVLVYRNGYWVNEVASGGLDTTQLANYLSNHGYVTQTWVNETLGDYVTIGTNQTITGIKTHHQEIMIARNGEYTDPKRGVWCALKTPNPIAAGSFIKAGGTSSQFLKADGSVDSTAYVNKAGDTMSGQLSFNSANFGIYCAGTVLAFKSGDGLDKVVIANDCLRRSSQTSMDLGASNIRWSTLFADTINVTSTDVVTNLNADMLDGLHNGELNAKWLNINNDANGSSCLQYMQRTSDWKSWEAPKQNWFHVLKMNHGNGDSYFSRTLAFDFFSDRIYTHRKQSGKDTGWSTLAFTTDNVASATKLQTARKIFGNDFDGSGDVKNTFLLNNGDATLRIYDIASYVDSNFGKETIGIQSCFDGQDPISSNYVTSFANRCLIALQPRGGIVAIGTTTPVAGAKLHVAGNIYSAGEITATNTSDVRLKENIGELTNAVSMLQSLGGYYVFDYKESSGEQQRRERIGLIWQNVSGHLAELMSLKRDDGFGALNYLKADYINLIGAATLETASEVERLKERVKELEQELERRSA